MQAIVMKQERENTESKDHHAWLDRLCESMRSSIDEAAASFDESKRLREQIASLQHEKRTLADDVKTLQKEKAGLEAENGRLRKHVTKATIRDISIDELTSSLNRTNIDADSVDKRMHFAQVFQRRFEAMREELQDRMPELAQERSQSRLRAVGYAIRCADVLLESHLASSNAINRRTPTKRQQQETEDSPKSLRHFSESLTILDRHVRALHTKLWKHDFYFQLIANVVLMPSRIAAVRVIPRPRPAPVIAMFSALREKRDSWLVLATARLVSGSSEAVLIHNIFVTLRKVTIARRSQCPLSQGIVTFVNIMKYLFQDFCCLPKIWRFFLPESEAQHSFAYCIPPASRYMNSSTLHSGEK
ncbi:hypothetical protein K469DRAFT_687505 [Zopfia rhizophila CBS 207.26]|uniref:Uncharacterized protein n=1 Tax=Zopfia rhizophila CBS 207.26 TaxID=1314779 RepID=A0A6A6E5R9_9PEZI|nr:hypothetical protein K469DRAFT_687505 [Zopfia rhizophila CBS 207.26]